MTGLKKREIAVFDKAYVHFKHLFSLSQRGTFWAHSFARIFSMIRAVVWDRFDLDNTLRFYGTAGGHWRMCIHPQTAYLPGFAP